VDVNIDLVEACVGAGELRLVCREPWCRLERILSAASSLGLFRLGRAVVKVTAKDRDVLDICSDQPALWSMRVAMTGRFCKVGGWRVKL
jgi:hypothetical protein